MTNTLENSPENAPENALANTPANTPANSPASASSEIHFSNIVSRPWNIPKSRNLDKFCKKYSHSQKSVDNANNLLDNMCEICNIVKSLNTEFNDAFNDDNDDNDDDNFDDDFNDFDDFNNFDHNLLNDDMLDTVYPPCESKGYISGVPKIPSFDLEKHNKQVIKDAKIAFVNNQTIFDKLELDKCSLEDINTLMLNMSKIKEYTYMRFNKFS
jgi:hypothetical protein